MEVMQGELQPIKSLFKSESLNEADYVIMYIHELPLCKFIQIGQIIARLL